MRVVRVVLWAVVGFVALAGALAGYFLYTPEPKPPQLSGVMRADVLTVGGRVRSYLSYVPKGLAPGAPLVLVLHGSGGNGRRIERDTGYGFDRLADRHGFAVVYPDGFEGYWNGCNIVGDYSANTLDIDDVGFLTALVDAQIARHGIDAKRVFAVGVSRGGHMALRLAIEAPHRFARVAAVAASMPTDDNFKCKPIATGTSSVLIMNGTEDPVNPFEGGDVGLFGLLARGTVRSSRASAQMLADRNAIAEAPTTRMENVADGVKVERVHWQGTTGVEIELVAIHGGGHVMPQPYWRAPRILGRTPVEPDGPALIWAFFAR